MEQMGRKTKRKTKSLMFFMTLACIFCVSEVPAEESLIEAFREGKPYFSTRLRHEFVDQEGFSKDANASTASTRLGFKSAEWRHWVGVIEGENVAELGNDSYNNTINGKTDRPVVADVENTQLNQGYLEFTGIPGYEPQGRTAGHHTRWSSFCGSRWMATEQSSL